MGLLSTLAGIRSGPGTSAPRPEPAPEGAPFANALMEALGLAGRPAPTTGSDSQDSGVDGGELHSLLAMLAESSEVDVDGSTNGSPNGSLKGGPNGGPNGGEDGGLFGGSTGGETTPFDGTFGSGALAGALRFSNDADGTPGRPGAVLASSNERVLAGLSGMSANSGARRVSHPGTTSIAESDAGAGASGDGSAESGVAPVSASEEASPTSTSVVDTEVVATGSGQHLVSDATTTERDAFGTADPDGMRAEAMTDSAANDADFGASEAPVTTAAAIDSDSGSRATEGIAASAASSTSTPVARTLPVTRADPSLDKVAPELREKVERVIERMRDEFGHEVTVVEGYRSPNRQAHLYEQGRSRPGEIATWTRRSWHSEGLAADLMVDGTYEDPLGYARLQRIAREEGLKTLGSRDMGHVELPGSVAEPEPQVATRSGRRFVGVAQPAPTAAVAAVAAVATPGQWVTDVAAEPAVQGLAATADVIADASGQADSETPRAVDTTTRSDFGSRLADAAPTTAPTQRGDATVTGTTEAGAAEQAARIQELRAMTEAAQPSRVSVRLDGGDQVRVGLLDRTVDAALDISDPDRAAAVRSRVADLHQALESRGLDLGALSLNGTTGTSATSSWLGGAGDPASEIIRTLLGGGAGDQGSNNRGSERASAEERTRNQGGSDSNRSRRDAEQERDR